MNRAWLGWIVLAVGMTSACSRHAAVPADAQPKAFGAALVLVSGDKQAAGVGSALDQPVVVQVNDDKGTAVAGALVRFAGSGGVTFDPDHGLTGSDGQFTTNVSLGGIHGRYQIVAATRDSSGKAPEIRIDEIALGYQEMLGKQVSDIHCVRCHDSESTPQRVSNHDNLTAQAHAFTDGATLNAMSDADLAAIISHGGAALGKSAEMPPYGNTLTKPEIDALVGLLRALADPPYRPLGIFYAGK
ncbi:MAG: c-type cytochrome [Bryobacteraceae bacterium]